MCQLIPRKVLALKGDRAQVDHDGTPRWVGVSDAIGSLATGEFVHVYAGVAIEKVSPEEAEAQMRFLRELEEGFPAHEEGA